jgi:AraC-like DNA-binding protein
MHYQNISIDEPFKFGKGIVQTGANAPYELHMHDCLEVNIVVQNRIVNHFGDHSFIGEEGDVFVCRPFEAHWGRAYDDKPATWIMLLFPPASARLIPDGFELLLPFYTDMLPSPVIPADSPHAQAVARAAKQAFAAQQDRTRTSRPSAFVHFIEILIHIYKYAETKRSSRHKTGELEPVLAAIQEMIMNYKENMSTDRLVQASGLGKTVFFNMFRSVTGTSPHDFLIKLRVQDAMERLRRQPKSSVVDICLESGFQSLRTFNQRFKEYTGCSPSQYRLQMHGDR